MFSASPLKFLFFYERFCSQPNKNSHFNINSRIMTSHKPFSKSDVDAFWNYDSNQTRTLSNAPQSCFQQRKVKSIDL